MGSRQSESVSSARSSGHVCFSPAMKAAAWMSFNAFFQRRSEATMPSALRASRMLINASIVSSVMATLATSAWAFLSSAMDSATDGTGSGAISTALRFDGRSK